MFADSGAATGCSGRVGRTGCGNGCLGGPAAVAVAEGTGAEFRFTASAGGIDASTRFRRSFFLRRSDEGCNPAFSRSGRGTGLAVRKELEKRAAVMLTHASH